MGWSQSELAMKLSASSTLIREWEMGLSEPDENCRQALELFSNQARLATEELARIPEIESQLSGW